MTWVSLFLNRVDFSPSNASVSWSMFFFLTLLIMQVPQRLYSLDELKLNGIDPSSLLSPADSTLGSIERNLQLSAFLGGVAAWNAFELNQLQILYLSLGLLFLWTLDLVISLLFSIAQGFFPYN